MNMKSNLRSLRVCSRTAFLALVLGTVLIPWPAVGGDDNDWDRTTNPPSIFNQNSGNVGIGTQNPQAKLDIHVPSLYGFDSTPALAVRRNVIGLLPFGPASLTTDFIVENGRVGIGKTNSKAKLTVSNTAASTQAILGINSNDTLGTPAIRGIANYGIGIEGITQFGKAGFFHAINPSNPNPALQVIHQGVGPAGFFKGRGDPLLLLVHQGPTGNPALWFQQDGVTKAYVWWDQLNNRLNLGTPTTNPILSLQDGGAMDVAGIIHSSSGGFKFPDNTVQTTAKMKGGKGDKGDPGDPVNTVSICVDGGTDGPGICSCTGSGFELDSIVGTSVRNDTCTIVSDSGECTAKGLLGNGGSCCLCAPLSKP